MGKLSKTSDLLAELRQFTDKLSGIGSLDSETEAKRLRKALESAAAQLQAVAVGHDPVERPASFFDPTNPAIAGRLVAVALVAQQRDSLREIKKFYGSGVYAIYYTGKHPAYKLISKSEHPIYVGKADPADGHAKSPVEQGIKLHARLQEHAKSIRNSSNLDLEDFECRFLVVATGWQKSAEDYLIRVFRPVWNSEVKICYGIGKHGDDALTRKNKRSPWDTMHPGRQWASKTEMDQNTVDNITKKIQAHFRELPPYKSREDIISHLLDEMRLKPKKA